MTREQVLAAALGLDPRSRGEIAAKLIASLEDGEEGLSRMEWEAAWTAEAERRLAEMDDGKVKAIPAEAVFAEMRARRGSSG